MRPATKRLTLAAAAVAAVLTVPVTASAATCDLNLEQAYQKALARGWNFKCLKSVLVFNKGKRPGCFLKTGIAGVLTGTGNFFCGDLRNGWRFVDFDVTGGHFRKNTGHSCLASYSFAVYGANTSSQRYLSKFTIAKDGGNCANALDEAF